MSDETSADKLLRLLQEDVAQKAAPTADQAPDTGDPTGSKQKLIDSLQEHAVAATPAAPPPDMTTPATPGTLGYIVGMAKRGLGMGGANSAASAAAELGSLPFQPPPTPESLSVPTQAQANTEIFGRPNVVAPNAVARYAGAVAEGIEQNPVLGALTIGPTITSLVGSQAGADLFPNSRWAPFLGGVVGGMAPAAVMAPAARGAASLLAGTPSQAAAEALSLGHQYGVNLRATQVPGSSKTITAANNALQYVPLAGTGREIGPVVDQWHQAINKAIGGDPTAKTISTEALGLASRSNHGIIEAAQQAPFSLTRVGAPVMKIIEDATPAMTTEEQKILPQIIANLKGAGTYGDAISQLDNMRSVASSPAVTKVIGQLKSKLQDTLGSIGESMDADGNIVRSPYNVARQRQQNLDVVRSMPRTNGQIDPDVFNRTVNGSAVPEDLSDLSAIAQYLKIPPARFSVETRHIIEPLAGVAEAGLALAGHHPGMAGVMTGAPIATGMALKRFQNYISGPQMANNLFSKFMRQFDPSMAAEYPSGIGPNGIGMVTGGAVGANNALQRR